MWKAHRRHCQNELCVAERCARAILKIFEEEAERFQVRSWKMLVQGYQFAGSRGKEVVLEIPDKDGFVIDGDQAGRRMCVLAA